MPARHAAEPNVTPMIDVLLVLIVAFMVLVVGQRKAMDVQLPVECTGACDSGDAIVLEVLGNGAYRLNQQPVDHASLERRLTAVYFGRPGKILSVTGRGTARYGEVMEAMDVARAAGVRVISVVPKGL
jgi:biopolymer transport protein ExbD